LASLTFLENHARMIIMRILLVVGSLFLCVGCGPKIGQVSGDVAFKGKPIPGGLITFCPADETKNSVSYELERDGKFSVELPAGIVRVYLDNREFEPRPATMPALAPGLNLPPEVAQELKASSKESSKPSDRWVNIPAKYHELETTDLQFEVKGGTQTELIELSE
jgi:hypothetical protein